METEGRYKLEVVGDSTGRWVSNALRFDSAKAALEYGQDLAWRWTAVRKIRVFDTEAGAAVGDEVQY
jgi:hypothetical protein